MNNFKIGQVILYAVGENEIDPGDFEIITHVKTDKILTVALYYRINGNYKRRQFEDLTIYTDEFVEE